MTDERSIYLLALTDEHFFLLGKRTDVKEKKIAKTNDIEMIGTLTRFSANSLTNTYTV